MKKIGDYIKEKWTSFKTWISEDSRNMTMVILIIAVLVMFSMYVVSNARYKKALEQIASSEEQISTYKNKYDEEYVKSKTYIMSINELKKTNESLYKEVKSLKDNPIFVSKIKYVTRIDTITIYSDVTRKDSMTLEHPIHYQDEWCCIDGRNTIRLDSMKSETAMDSILFNNEMTLDLIEKDDALYLIGKSANPYVKINNIESVMVSPEKSKMLKKRFNKPWGIMIGLGGTLSIYNKQLVVLPGLQITVGYKFISF